LSWIPLQRVLALRTGKYEYRLSEGISPRLPESCGRRIGGIGNKHWKTNLI
jgi:hypothetical protein